MAKNNCQQEFLTSYTTSSSTRYCQRNMILIEKSMNIPCTYTHDMNRHIDTQNCTILFSKESKKKTIATLCVRVLFPTYYMLALRSMLHTNRRCCCCSFWPECIHFHTDSTTLSQLHTLPCIRDQWRRHEGLDWADRTSTDPLWKRTRIFSAKCDNDPLWKLLIKVKYLKQTKVKLGHFDWLLSESNIVKISVSQFNTFWSH